MLYMCTPLNTRIYYSILIKVLISVGVLFNVYMPIIYASTQGEAIY